MREGKKEKDQANLRRADESLSHKQLNRFVVKDKITKSEISFEDDQVSDLTRRCEKVNIYK
jgi:hypothetical protein